MEHSGQEILDKIKEQKIQPKKRWEFLFKNYFLWLAFALAIILGGLASSATIFVFKHVTWVEMAPGFSPLKRLWVNLPLFWLLSLLLFCFLAWYDFKNTKRGYKYHPLIIVSWSVVLSIALGVAMYSLGLGQKLEDTFFRRVPLYKQMFRQGGRMLVEPDKGHLVGVIISMNSDFITIEDFRGRSWTISTSTAEFQVGQRVMLIGRVEDGNNFICESIKPWLKNPGPPPPPMFFQP
ncbi:MAG: hypothetical protein WCV69_02065 [Patescibacteria group bacterium]|jgi:hypothetical protein